MITNAKFIAADYDDHAYHGDNAERGAPDYVMSRSALCAFAVCPEAWKDGKEKKDSDATDYGSLIDCLLLCPQRFDSRYAIKPEFYTAGKTGESKKWNGNATECKAWADENAGMEQISLDDHQEALKAVARLERDAAIQEYMMCSLKAVYYTAEWKDENGIVVPLKILIDLVPDAKHPLYGKTLGDFKSGRDAGLRKWGKAVSDYHYAEQSAMYLDVYNAAEKQDRNDFRHVVQENVAPYQPAKRIISSEFIALGRMRYQNALAAYARCLKSKSWPDYDTAAPGINGWAFVEPEAYMVK